MAEQNPGTGAGETQPDPKPGETPAGEGKKPTLTDSEAKLLKENMAMKKKLEAIESANTKAEENRLKEQGEFKTLAEKNASKAEAAINRLKYAELKAAAIHAGILDPDFVRLADVSGVTVSDDGSVEGVEEVIADLKSKKPSWFTAAGNPPVPKTPIPGKPSTAGATGPATFLDWEKMPIPERTEWASKHPAEFAGLCGAQTATRTRSF